ncbi:MAG: complex I NDUFA9 subunit family protein [Pseudomonadota bacterium]
MAPATTGFLNDMSEPTVCLLGGTGFIGRSLAAELCSNNVKVRVPTRRADSARRLRVLPTVNVRITDVHDPAALTEALRGCDAIVNLIGILNESGNKGRGFDHAHADFAEKLLGAADAAGVKRLVQVSALKASIDGPSYYLKSKGKAEKAIRESSLDWTILQPSVVFGSEDSFTNRFAGLLKLLPVLPLARPNARFAPVYVGDVVAVIERALRDEAMIGQTYQLCGPRVYSLRELVDFIRETAGLGGSTLGLPDSLAKLQARISEWVPGKPFSMDNFRSLTVHSICDTSGLKTLGIEPHSLEAMAPAWLAPVSEDARLDRFRRDAGR